MYELDAIFQMKPLEDLNAERREKALAVFTPTQVHNWEGRARLDAEAGEFKPPTEEDLKLAQNVYIVAWSRRRYKISREKRDEADALFAAGDGSSQESK